jgi:hypothetical protein
MLALQVCQYDGRLGKARDIRLYTICWFNMIVAVIQHMFFGTCLVKGKSASDAIVLL